MQEHTHGADVHWCNRQNEQEKLNCSLLKTRTAGSSWVCHRLCKTSMAGPASVTRGFDSWIWGYWIPVIAYAGLIFFLSDQSYPEKYVPIFTFPGGDKLDHALEYSVLGVLCYRAFRYAAGEWASRYALLLAIVAAFGYGVSDEFHQYFVPLREADVWDILADTVGASIGASGWHHRWR